jgi:hypothetical protein
VLALYLYAAALVTYLAANVAASPFFDPAAVVLLQQASYLTVATWVLLVLISRRRFSDSACFIHVPIQLYALNSAFFRTCWVP